MFKNSKTKAYIIPTKSPLITDSSNASKII